MICTAYARVALECICSSCSSCFTLAHTDYAAIYYSSSTANACLEAAKKAKSPVIIQVSNGGGAFVSGKAVKDSNSAAIGSVALAMHVRTVAAYYGIPVVLHSDHCAKKVSIIMLSLASRF
jgi:fructose/tagatose bisphosphate aldolase